MPLFFPPPVDTIGDTSLYTIIRPGTSKAAEITAAIAAASSGSSAVQKRTVKLLRGTYTLETAITGANYVRLEMDRESVLVPTFTGGTDDYTAVIKAEGTLNTSKLNTTLSANVVKGRVSVSVTASGTLAGGDYIAIEGWNAAQDALGMSDGSGSILSEIIRVDTSYTASLTVPTCWPVYQNHGTTNITVKAVTPVVGFEVHGGTIRGCQSSVTSSVGVLFRYSVDCEVHNVSAEGFTRAAVDVESSKGFKSSGFRNLGNSNCWYFISSVCDGDIWDFDGLDGVTRNNALGVVRPQIYMRRRCTDMKVHDGRLTNGALGGFFHAGGVNLSFSNIHIRNQVITQAVYDRWVASGEQENGGKVALGFGSGHGPLGIAEFAFGCTYSDITVEDLRAPNSTGWNDSAPRRAVAAYIHDTMRIGISNISCVAWDTVAGDIVGGIIFSDVDGGAQNIMVKGHTIGLAGSNVLTDLKVDRYRYDAIRGATGNAAWPIYLDYDASSNRGMKFDGVHVTNAFSFLRFGAGFVYDPNFEIRDLITDQGQWSYCVLANNQTGVSFSTGDIVEIDPTNTNTDLRIRTPNEASDFYRRLAAVASGASEDVGTGFILIAPLPQDRATVTATGSIAYGDSVSYLPTRMVTTVANGSGTLGVSRTRKAGVAAGKITLKGR